VNQLDLPRDEAGYYRKFRRRRKRRERTVNGTLCGDCIFRGAMPEVYAATIRDIKGFADSLN
jgi:hypothetical protein